MRSGQSGYMITNNGHIASFGAGDAITLAGGGTVANSGRFAGFVAGTQNGLSAGSVIANRGTRVLPTHQATRSIAQML